MTGRFNITFTRGAYYVDIPNYSGGEVVPAEAFDEAQSLYVETLQKAADEIAMLRQALVPFGELADEGNEDQPDDTKVVVQAGRSTCYGLTLTDLRHARALATPSDPDGARHE